MLGGRPAGRLYRPARTSVRTRRTEPQTVAPSVPLIPPASLDVDTSDATTAMQRNGSVFPAVALATPAAVRGVVPHGTHRSESRPRPDGRKCEKSCVRRRGGPAPALPSGDGHAALQTGMPEKSHMAGTAGRDRLPGTSPVPPATARFPRESRVTFRSHRLSERKSPSWIPTKHWSAPRWLPPTATRRLQTNPRGISRGFSSGRSG